ncbi:MAG TPA: TIGR04283 family arsenosugar biosynthesis glycosyltransferase [Flavobacteriaceae bacterium]|nr:TIGR04283 family arsenosugar biosynthesis glycosyltransferase [Flavobacteriaceae bacterium]
MNEISIIIPILNEEKTIGKLLQYLIKNSSKENIAEIIVVDGGSTDGSQEIIKKVTSSNSEYSEELYREVDQGLDTFSQCENTRPDIQLLNAEKGRAKQMNLGAKHSKGNILYFLHADSFPPKHFDKHIINEIEKNNLAGCFRMQFDNKHWWLRLASWLTQFRWRACRGGDQSLFMTKKLFDTIGGYNETYMIYEDNILINELYKRDSFVVINKKLKTSARRYEKNGVWRLQFHFWTIYVKKWFGASAEELYSYYKKHMMS